MANEYVTQQELKESLSMAGETFADPDIDLALTAASRAIDAITRRRFWLDSDATQVRYYTPDERGRLKIDDIVDVTSVQTDQDGDGTFEETWTENSDYVLEPLNAAADGRPWETLRAHPTGSYRFPTGFPRSVKVTGQFGWNAVPDEVKVAATIIATRLLRRAREAPFGVVAIGLDSGSAMRIARTDPDVMGLLGDLTRNPIAVA